MTSRFRLRLFTVLFVFAVIITFSIAAIDHQRLKERTVKDNELQIDQVTETVKYALNTIDKAYYYLDAETSVKMTDNTMYLQNKYKENQDISTWDLDSLSEKLEMDIYFFDEGNKIVYSNSVKEIGLDFSVCCQTFDKVLKERRESGELYIDGIDVDQQTGEVKKFSYMATPDKKYLIELGYSLENEQVFKEFNFLKITDELVDEFDIVDGIQVLNFGGLPFGTVQNSDEVPPKRRDAFERVRETNEIVEIKSVYKGKEAIYRYIPYQSKYDEGSTKTKVVEIIYSIDNLNLLLKENQKTLLIQLILILFVTFVVSSVIASWFAKPVYLAYHDSLTDLKNRASFDDYLGEVLADKNEQTALLMMDLDNFKLVNDYLGHGKGDYLLRLIAQTIKEAVGKYETFRLGGDEFAVIMKNGSQEDAEIIAEKIIKELNHVLKKEKDICSLSVSISVGIAISTKDISPNALYKHADIALYQSKEKGKNQYQVFKEQIEPNIPFS